MKMPQSSREQSSALPNRMQQLAGSFRRHRVPACACLILTTVSLAAAFYLTRPTASLRLPPPVAAAEVLPAVSESPADSRSPEIPTNVSKSAVGALTKIKARSLEKTPAYVGGSSLGPLNVAAPASRMDLDEMRKAGRIELQRQLATHAAKPASVLMAKAAPADTGKLELAPLPTEPLPAIREAIQPAGAQVDCCPGALPPLPEPAKDEEAGNVERRQLAVAAQEVGKGDWKAAHDLYRQLATTTQDELVRVALRRNLEVSEHQLDIQNEPDQSRREWLELDLARIHNDLGHSQAAQRMWRDLEIRALHPDVRAQSARLRLDPPRPTRPVTLPAVQPQSEATK